MTTSNLWPEGEEHGVWASLDGVFEETDEDDGLVRFVLAEPGAVVDGRLRFKMTLGEGPLKPREGEGA